VIILTRRCDAIEFKRVSTRLSIESSDETKIFAQTEIIMQDSTLYGFIAYVIANLLLQIFMIWEFYGKNWKELRKRWNMVLRGEITICAISILSFFVFLLRLFPMWQTTGCFAWHVIMM
jgi:hypothetical protein